MPIWPFSRRRTATAFLGLGSNVGDRLGALAGALADLDATDDIAVETVSAVYETEPVGGPDQDPYLNLVAAVTTERSPRQLLGACQEIERRRGRDRAEELRYGPRTLDIDILLYDDQVIREPDLEVPHPRLTERAFALVPLAEVVPAGTTLPDGHTVTWHLARLAPITGVELHVRLTEGPGTAAEPLLRRPPGPPGATPHLGDRWQR